MKKFVFALLAFSSLLVLSCRQQEEMMDSEDLKSLSVLKEATSKTNKQISDSTVVNKQTTTNVTSDAFQVLEIDRDKPPY